MCARGVKCSASMPHRNSRRRKNTVFLALFLGLLVLTALDIVSGPLLLWLAVLTAILGAYDFGKTIGVEAGRAEQDRVCFKATNWCSFCGTRAPDAASCCFRHCPQGLPFEKEASNYQRQQSL